MSTLTQCSATVCRAEVVASAPMDLSRSRKLTRPSRKRNFVYWGAEPSDFNAVTVTLAPPHFSSAADADLSALLRPRHRRRWPPPPRKPPPPPQCRFKTLGEFGPRVLEVGDYPRDAAERPKLGGLRGILKGKRRLGLGFG